MTGRSIITQALKLLNIVGTNETPSADDMQLGLQWLNSMCAAWRTQSLTVLAIERQIFDLTANQQQYSIGTGAEFNVPRPQSVSGAALLLNGLSGPQAVTITRSGTMATVSGYSGVSVGEEVYVAGCDEQAYNQSQIVLTVPSGTSFTYQVFGSPVTPATGAPTVQQYQGNPVEIPRAMMTDDAYQAVQLKNLTNSQFTNVYYNPTQPYGAIWLWPIPNTDQNQLVLYLQSQFGGFADVNVDYTYPAVPGYEEALVYNLGKRLLVPFTVKEPSIIAEVRDMAKESLALVKRQNYKLSDLPTDPALTMNRHGGYNINTDSQ